MENVQVLQQDRLSAIKASKLFKIPKDKLAKWILKQAGIGFPIHPEEVKDDVQNVIIETKQDNPFRDNRPGHK